MKTEQLNTIVQDSINSLSRSFADFPWENKEAYAQWLAQTYYFVRHTTTFLALVAAHYGPDHRANQYHTLKHLREEMNHDLLALEDLKALGYSIDQFPELPQTAAFYQTQYYFIEYHGPSTLLGYQMCLEGIAANEAGQIAQTLNKTYGPKPTRFMKSHSAADQEHIVEGFEGLSKVSPSEAELIAKNTKQSEYLYKALLNGILEASKKQQPLKNAA